VQWLILLFAIAAQENDAGVRAWPGACPQACCSYNTDWIATTPAQVFAEPNPSSDAARTPVFTVQPGETVRALTGTLFTLSTGTLRVDEDFSTEATYSDFSDRHRQMVTLNAGETRDLFAVRGESIYRLTHKGAIVDATLRRVGTREACARARPSCAGVVTKPPVTRWWVMVMNGQKAVGWIEEPRNFTVPQACR
jgi:hypothetical protein